MTEETLSVEILTLSGIARIGMIEETLRGAPLILSAIKRGATIVATPFAALPIRSVIVPIGTIVATRLGAPQTHSVILFAVETAIAKRKGEAMALELMREEMVRQLTAHSAPEAQVAGYLKEWNEAIAHSGKPLPCPSCYLKGEIRRLKPISEEHGVAVVRCEHCREAFEFESPETK